MTITLQQAAKDALAVQDACNLSGVAHSFLDAVQAVNAAEDLIYTGRRNRHPIIQLYVYKLAALAGFEPIDWGVSEEWDIAITKCRRIAEGTNPLSAKEEA